MVGREGLEPSRLFKPTDFKSVAYTNSATRPRHNLRACPVLNCIQKLYLALRCSSQFRKALPGTILRNWFFRTVLWGPRKKRMLMVFVGFTWRHVPDSHRPKSFCRPLPNFSANVPYLRYCSNSSPVGHTVYYIYILSQLWHSRKVALPSPDEEER
jgi:hypothetical protein